MASTKSPCLRAQVRVLNELIESCCLTCGAELVWEHCYAIGCEGGTCNDKPCRRCGGLGGWQQCSQLYMHDDDEYEFEELERLFPLLYKEKAPRLADEATVLTPGPSRAEVYRQRFHDKRAIFHPADRASSPTVARTVSRGNNGAVILKGLVGETKDREDDDDDSTQVIDQADESRIAWLEAHGYAMQSEAVKGRVGADQAVARSAPHADARRDRPGMGVLPA